MLASTQRVVGALGLRHHERLAEGARELALGLLAAVGQRLRLLSGRTAGRRHGVGVVSRSAGRVISIVDHRRRRAGRGRRSRHGQRRQSRAA